MVKQEPGPLLELWPSLASDLEEWLVPPVDSLPALSLDRTALAALKAQAEPRKGLPWPSLPASAWARFLRDGDREDYQSRLFARTTRLSQSVLMAAATEDQQWLDDTADGVVAVCEQSSWCWPAHDDSWSRSGHVLPDPERPFLDLGASEVASQLAWIDHLAGAALERRLPGLRARLRQEVSKRVFEPFEGRTDWHWLGIGEPIHNWAPWIAGNLLVAALRLEEDPVRRRLLLESLIAVLDRYAAALPPDGACEEGQGYWWNGPCRLLEALAALRHATNGRLDALGIARFRRTVAFPHSSHLGGPWFVNHADASARPGREQPWHSLWRLGGLMGDQAAMDHALDLRRHGTPDGVGWPAPPADSLGRAVFAMADGTWWELRSGRSPLPQAVWHPSVEVMVAREHAGKTDGLAVAAKGGHNGEPHNHNDVGSVIVALDGTPVLVDAGRPTYTAQTFGPDRYAIWAMQSEWHNVPRIGGRGQSVGRRHGARGARATFDRQGAVFEAELAGAYQVPGLAAWRRRVRLDLAAQAVEIADAWRWEAEAGQPVELRFLIAGQVVRASRGLALIETLAGGTMELTWPKAFEFKLAGRELDDPSHWRVWGARLSQLRLDPGAASESKVVCCGFDETKRSQPNNVPVGRG
ncbi:MAG: heparinase II/III-family protein [Bifidobacteriaceae bacterium]|nr:heparinase II/III-family protein [Bifidobacteriaceae bacterium]